MSVPAESLHAAVQQGVSLADGEDSESPPEGERKAVKKLFDEYSTARAFDKFARQRYTRDRRYASGTANKAWASDANIIGAYIDILVSFLYAKDPDVSARPAEHVPAPPEPPPALIPPMPGMPGAPPINAAPAALPGPDVATAGAAPIPVEPAPAFGAPTMGAPLPGDLGQMGAPLPPGDPMAALTAPGMPPAAPVAPPAAQSAQPMEEQDAQQFAKTAQIVVSKQWKKADLKRKMKRVVRAALSVGPGWFKAYMYSEQGRNPKVEKELSDARDNMERIEKLQNDLTGVEPEVDPEVTMEELKLQIAALEKRIELLVKRGMCIDFIRSEDIQISLDVPSLADYRDADWISHDLYIEKESAKARFPRLTDADIKRATEYVQRDSGKDDVSPVDNFMQPDSNVPEGVYVRATDNVGQGSGTTLGGKDKPVKFIKAVELWDHRDMNVKTMVDGVERWAADPFVPEYASSRYFPFFMLAFYEVDGSRHPQSLPERSWKLQDEYSSRRSSGRKTRERSIPGTWFNATELTPKDVEKLQQSTEAELVGLKPVTPGAKISDLMGPKQIPTIDPALFATGDILYDFNVVTGVTEAQSSANSDADTATEADIQQSGSQSRSGADRDVEEDLLTEFAQYTLEVAVQCLTARDVQRLAGPYAFWPEGMDVEDILTLVEIEIEAGTTGKPRAQADKETWATLLPLILDLIPQIRLAQSMGDVGTAETLTNILRETLRRLDDRLSIESILSAVPALPMPMPGMPGATPTSATTGDAGTPPTGNGTVNNPAAQGAPPV